RYGPIRRLWLQNRFLTEVLRQWHFRHLLDAREWASQVPSEADLRQRAKALKLLLADIRGIVGRKMDELVSSGLNPLGKIPQPFLPADERVKSDLLGAYRNLRLEHQIRFAQYKLSPDDRTFARIPLDVLVVVTDYLAAATLFLALGCSIAQLFNPIEWA